MIKIICCLLLVLSQACPATAAGQPSILERMLQLEKSLVGIRTVYTRTIKTAQGKKRVTYTRQGTGIIINRRGIIVTNTHIIKNAPRIEVTFHDGRMVTSEKLLFASIDHDFSIIKVTPPYPLVPVKFADSATATIGSQVLAIGASEYNDKSIMAGHITSLIQNRSNNHIEFIETDLNLYQGDSGGPLFNAQGRLLGMVMAKRQSKQHSSLCIASDHIHQQYLRTAGNIR